MGYVPPPPPPPPEDEREVDLGVSVLSDPAVRSMVKLGEAMKRLQEETIATSRAMRAFERVASTLPPRPRFAVEKEVAWGVFEERKRIAFPFEDRAIADVVLRLGRLAIVLRRRGVVALDRGRLFRPPWAKEPEE